MHYGVLSKTMGCSCDHHSQIVYLLADSEATGACANLVAVPGIQKPESVLDKAASQLSRYYQHQPPCADAVSCSGFDLNFARCLQYRNYTEGFRHTQARTGDLGLGQTCW
jgi:hypothetical protein